MIEITTKDYIDFCFWMGGIRGVDDTPLYFIIWKMPEKHNIRRELWNKIGIQRVWGDAYNNKGWEVPLSRIPKEYHRGIIFALFQFQHDKRTEYMDVSDHSIPRDRPKKAKK